MASEPGTHPSGDESRLPGKAGIGGIDLLGRVVGISSAMSMIAAQRYERMEALRADAMGEASKYGGPAPEITARSLRLEVATALQITEYMAERMLITADGVVNRYPTLLESLSDGHTTERHAEVFVELVDTVEPELLPQVVSIAVELAETTMLGEFRRRLRLLVDTVRVATLEERHREAMVKRRVVIEPSVDGMAWLLVYMPVVEARAIHNRVTAIAKVLAKEEGEERTVDQLRADTVGDLLVDGDFESNPAGAKGIRATVATTVPALSLLDDEFAADNEPAVVEGVGPIPIARARELCGGADGWMRVLTHPETGVVLSVGRRKYKPPKPLRDFVRWRAGRCLTPGCSQAAARCEIDHTIAWEDGGCTDDCNLGPLCKGHHTVKHHGGWLVRQIENGEGALEWISPAGRRYVVQPERRVPVFRPSPDEEQRPQGTPPF